MLNKLKKFNNIILLTAMIAFACVLIFNIISWDKHVWISTCYILLRITAIIILSYIFDSILNRKIT